MSKFQIRLIINLLFAFLTALVYNSELEAQNNSGPNIIYILADDLGYGDLSCYGQEKLKTPNIDRIAEEGMLFSDHYSGNTVCSPSRAVLMTGQHPGHVHCCTNSGPATIALDPDMVTGTYSAGKNEECPDVINPIAGYAAMMEHFDNQIGGNVLWRKRTNLSNEVFEIFCCKII